MELVIGDEQDLAHAVARRISEVLLSGTRCPRVGLATGKSPRLAYEILRGLHQNRHIDLTRAVWVMLDEYVGLPPGHERRFDQELRRSIFGDLLPAAINLVSPFPGDTGDDNSLELFRRAVAAEPTDLQLLGIGRNGHIAFNEPGSDFSSRARIVKLSETTRSDMLLDGWDLAEIPTYAATQGLSDVMASKEVLLLAFGESKVDAIHQAFRERPNVSSPASVLQNHPKVKLFITPEVARALR